ncbi:MAG: DUF3617 family protein [Oxalobacteraceae bacterium]|nr:MAG: DUF3617 family protein [Oxalobacteraceae bacterium]
MTSTVNMASIPGIKTVRNRSRTERHCVTPQSAMDGGRDLLIARGCTAKRFNFANGEIDVLTSCGPVGQAMLTMRSGGAEKRTELEGRLSAYSGGRRERTFGQVVGPATRRFIFTDLPPKRRPQEKLLSIEREGRSDRLTCMGSRYAVLPGI